MKMCSLPAFHLVKTLENFAFAFDDFNNVKRKANSFHKQMKRVYLIFNDVLYRTCYVLVLKFNI